MFDWFSNLPIFAKFGQILSLITCFIDIIFTIWYDFRAEEICVVPSQPNNFKGGISDERNHD